MMTADMVLTRAGADGQDEALYTPAFMAHAAQRKAQRVLALDAAHIDMVTEWGSAADLVSAMLLQRIVWWHLPNDDGTTKLRVRREGQLWLARSAADWMLECRLTGRQARHSAAKLRDLKLVDTHVWKFDGAPTTHFRLLMDSYVAQYQQALQRASDTHRSGMNGQLFIPADVTPVAGPFDTGVNSNGHRWQFLGTDTGGNSLTGEHITKEDNSDNVHAAAQHATATVICSKCSQAFQAQDRRRKVCSSCAAGKSPSKSQADPRIREAMLQLEAAQGYAPALYPAQARAVKTMLGWGYEVDAIMGAWRSMKGDPFWQRANAPALTMLSVVKQLGQLCKAGRIPGWVMGNDGKPQPAARGRGGSGVGSYLTRVQAMGMLKTLRDKVEAGDVVAARTLQAALLRKLEDDACADGVAAILLDSQGLLNWTGGEA